VPCFGHRPGGRYGNRVAKKCSAAFRGSNLISVLPVRRAFSPPTAVKAIAALADQYQRSMRTTQVIVVGQTPSNDDITIPRGEALYFEADCADWRRVRVRWNNYSLIISRSAWNSTSSVETLSLLRRSALPHVSDTC
jgi:hypothetical protein